MEILSAILEDYRGFISAALQDFKNGLLGVCILAVPGLAIPLMIVVFKEIFQQ